MTFNVVLFFALLAIAPVEAVTVTKVSNQKDNPIGKVVVLIKEIMSKIEGDGKMEQKTYDKFACWCEKTLARKAAAIDKAKEVIDATQREIIELKGKLGELGATIKQLQKEIGENEAAVKEATEIREKENADYSQERTESEQCIGALEAAVKVLTGAGTKKAMLQTIQEAQLLSVVDGVKNVLRRSDFSDTLKEDDLNVVKDWVQNPTKFLQIGHGFSGAQTSAKSSNPHGDYAPASDQVVGIMKGMYDSFTSNLEKANAEEGDKQKTFEELMATKKAEWEALTASLETATGAHAVAEKTLADDRVLLEDTKVQLAADEKFFEETTASCKAKATEWAERTRLRTEELQGIAKAIEILEGGNETFESSHNTFFQVAASSVDQKRTKAYSKLMALVSKGGSKQMAWAAAALKSGGHFDEVITMIDRMIADLRVEEQDDIKARDVCNNQENALKSQKEDLEYNIDKKKKLNKRQEAKKQDVIDAIVAKKDEIAIAEQTMAEMLTARNKENSDFKKALKDDVDAAALLTSAIASLTKYYTDNKIPLELIQQPEGQKYTVDEDQAPSADFSGGGKSKSESKGIIAILSMLREDLEMEMKTGREEEAEAQAEYEKLRGECQEAMDKMVATKTALEEEEATLDGKIADTQGEIDSHKEQLTNTADETEALKPSCEWVKSKFEARRTKRKAELEGLQEAKSILSGARPPSLLDQGIFLQQKKK